MSCVKVMIFCALILAFISPQLSANQFRYCFPTNITLDFTEKIEKVSDKTKLTATIASKLGILTNLEVYFSSSRDLKILSNTRTLKSLKAGVVRKVKILAVKTGEKADEMGSWVKMGVRYTPDYPAILAILHDSHEFPDQFERQRLIDVANKNKKAKSQYNDSVRSFLPAEGK